MAEVALFHHAQGLTTGVGEFAERLRLAGHTVHTPDLYDGHVFGTLEEGLGYARDVGFDVLLENGRLAGTELGEGLVYAGFSLGVMPAQLLAQTRPGAKGALLFESCIPPSEFGGPWPAGVPVQVHGMDADPIFAGDGDLDAARALVASTPDAELFVYPGNQHLFADASLPTYGEGAATLLTARAVSFLDAVSRTS